MREDAQAKLATSAIRPEEAEDAGIFDVDDASRIHAGYAPVPALVLPYYNPDGSKVRWGADEKPFERVRYLVPVFSKKKSWAPKKAIRYAQPAGSPLKVYFPWIGPPDGESPWPAILDDPKAALVITEGELKALCSCLCGAPTLGLGGVWNFAAPDGKLLPELAAINWHGRPVYIAFDSDAASNPQVCTAEARLVEELVRRSARPMLVRIPPAADGGKMGIDDYVDEFGAQHWLDLLAACPPMTAVERGVVALNEHIAWIEKESKAIDLRTHAFLQPQSLVSGSRFAAMNVAVPVTDGSGKTTIKKVQTAKVWLTHPYAQRYDDVLFRPSQGQTVEEDGKTAFNLWKGYSNEPGDVTPFLELTEFLFSRVRGEAAELPMKLLAYKAQHPEEKIPLAIILIGLQGCGKSLWSECVRDAFAPYSVELPSSALLDEHQGWLEKTLIAVINEAKAKDMFLGAERLRSLVSDERQNMNEKYRIARQVRNYTTFLITANSRAAGSFAGDDRRNIVVDCPPKRDKAFYSRVAGWKKAGGPRRLMDYLLSVDLGEWTPPVEAPMTAEKHMAFMEGLSPVQVVAAKALEANTSLVVEWLDASMQWALETETSGDVRAGRVADEIKRSIKQFQVRPFYTPEELALIFPAITRDLFGNRKVYSTVAGHISRQLRDAGLRYLECRDDPRGFKWRGQFHQFIIVADHADWSEPIGQADFDRLMREFPTYGAYRQKVTRISEIRARDAAERR